MSQILLGHASRIDKIAASTPTGTSFAVSPGVYVLTVTEEPVEITRYAATIEAGEGTPLCTNTQWDDFEVLKPETWAIRSKGGTGRLVLTPKVD